MKKYKRLSIITSLIISVIIFFGIVSLGSGVPLFELVNKNGGASVKPYITENAIDPDMPFKAFMHGSKYKHTIFDEADYESYRNGIKSDTVTVTVDRSQPHGSENNPYVIDSTTLWNTFASKMTAANNYGSGKYFALAADLDFGGVVSNFNCVIRFSGTFYGLGHTMTGVSIYGDKNNSGLFGYVINGVITDVNNKNAVVSEVEYNAGGIVGYMNGGKILNCHASVTFTRTLATGNQIMVGGVMGGAYGYGSNNSSSAVDYVYIYRCSAKSSLDITGNNTSNVNGSMYGGILSQTWHHGAPALFDCYAESELINAHCNNMYSSPIIGLISEPGANIRIENCVGKQSIKSNSGISLGDLFGAITNLWESADNSGFPMMQLNFKNVYGQCEYNSSANYTLLPVSSWQECLARYNHATMNFTNVKYGADYTDYTFRFYNKGVRWVDKANSLAARVTTSALWSELNGASSPFTANIWDRSKINDGNYLPDDAPNINKLDIKTDGSKQFTAEFKNYKTTGEESLGLSSIDFDYADTDTTLPTPTNPDANHQFVGWTTDTDGDSVPFTKLPDTAYGNVTFYAVWDNPNTSGAVTLTNSFTGDATDTLEYGTGSITLAATASGTGMNSPTKIFRWYKDGGSEPVNTGANYMLTDVLQSGVYAMEYTITDSIEKLWRHTEKLATTNKVTINKGKVTLLSFGLDSSTPAYFGMPLRELKFNLEVKNSGNKKVEGTFGWRVPGDTIIKGANSHEVSFRPTDTDNYDASYNLDVNFNSVSLTLNFVLDRNYITEDIAVELEYGQDYSLPVLTRLYNEEIAKKTDPSNAAYDPAFNSVLNLTPFFDGTDIANPTAADLAAFVTRFKGVNKIETINVTYQDKEYTVTFVPKNGDTVPSQSKKFNQFVTEPGALTYAGHAFLGWYVAESDGETPSATKWDFASDRVTGHLTLVAKWFKATLTLTGITVTPNKASYTALTNLTNSDLTVTAHYSTDAPGIPTLDEVINMGGSNGYTVTYVGSPDGKLHVKFPKISVSYSYPNGSAAPVELTLNVNPIKEDTSKLNFKDKTVVENGSVQSIDKINPSILPLGFTVEYEYWLGSMQVDEADVIAPGRYTVIAKFTSSDADFEADPITVTLTISRAASALTIEWDTTALQFNAKPQHPKATLKDIDGNVIDVPLHYEGDTDATSVRGGYRVQVVLDDPAYSIVGDDYVNFGIIRAVLNAPKLDTERRITYNGEPINVQDYLTGFDPDLMEITSGGTGDNSGGYVAVISLKNKDDCDWSGTSAMTVSLPWRIEKAHLTAEWDKSEEVFAAGAVFEPKVIVLTGIASVDAAIANLENDLIYSGDRGKSAAGAYTISVALNDAKWTGNYVLDGNINWDYVILPKAGMEVITIEWGETTLEFNDKVQTPSYTVFDRNGLDITEDVKNLLKFGGDYGKSKWQGDYKLEVSVTGNYYIRSGMNCEYTITLDENGNGEDPNKASREAMDNFPMWQVITTAAALLLFAVFTSKAVGRAKQRKKLNGEIEEINNRTYAMLPIFSVTPVLFGLPNMAWSIIAFVSVGIMVAGFAAMIANGKRLSKTEAELVQAKRDDNKRRLEAEMEDRVRREEEDRARREEDRRQREEDQQRRDDEMKMMFAGMMNMMRGNGSGGNGGGAGVSQDTAQIVKDVVAALLPVIQSQQSNVAYIPYKTGDGRDININVNGTPYDGTVYESAAAADDEENDVDDNDDEWDYLSEEDDDDIIYEDADGVKKSMPSNFRMRLKQSSDKNRIWYTTVKNMFGARKNVVYRVSGRVEKFKYQGKLIAVIGVAKRSLKLWLALDPGAYDADRYHQKDVSDKPRFAEIPMYVKISSERALSRAEELIYALFEDNGIEPRKRYTDRDIQELIFTLKHNKLLKDKENKSLLCESIHVHDCDVLSSELAERCIETRGAEYADVSLFEDIKLDDIDANFLDGQKVTLEVLKKKGLVSENCTGYTVTAGSRLNKPLIVCANDFTLPAVKMIVLTGGRAIRLTKI